MRIVWPSCAVTSAAVASGVAEVRVDGGYRQHLVEHAATRGIDMESTTRKPGPGVSPRSRNVGPSNGSTADSCSTAARPAIVKCCPPYEAAIHLA